MPRKDRVSAQKRKLIDQAGAARNQKKLNSFFVIQAPAYVQQVQVVKVVDTVDTSSQIANSQSRPITPENLDNAERVGDDVEVNSYPQDEIEFEPNVEHNYVNSESHTQDVEWINTEEEFTSTIRYLHIHYYIYVNGFMICQIK